MRARFVILSSAALFLAATAAWAELHRTPGKLSRTTQNSEVQVGTWQCPNLAGFQSLPLKVRWENFKTIQFSNGNHYDPNTKTMSPDWKPIGTLDREQDRVSTDVSVSIETTPAPGGQNGFTVKLEYTGNGSPKSYDAKITLGCTKG